jgi:hypothetical protein
MKERLQESNPELTPEDLESQARAELSTKSLIQPLEESKIEDEDEVRRA